MRRFNHLFGLVIGLIAIAPIVGSAQVNRYSRLPNRVTTTQENTPIQIEAEGLARNLRPKNGKVVAQNMAGFRGSSWSGGSQLLWTPSRANERLEIPVSVPRSGTYSVSIKMTRAPDFGDFQIGANGQAGKTLSGYGRAVSSSGLVHIGNFKLNRGSNQLVVVVTGKQRSSRGYFVGIDKIQLQATDRIPAVPKNDTVVLSGDAPGAQMYVRAGDIHLTSNQSIDPSKGSTKIQFTYDVTKVLNAKGIMFQVSFFAFDPHKKGQASLNPGSLTILKHVPKTFGIYEVDFSKLPTLGNDHSTIPRFYVRVVPVIDSKTVAGAPSNAMGVFYRQPSGNKNDFEFAEQFSMTRFEESVRKRLDGKCSGYSIGLRQKNGKAKFVNYGFARTSANGSPKQMSEHDRFNLASVSKTISTTALMRLLDQNGISIDAPIYFYLPPHWTYADSFKTITFREILTHRSGIRHTNPNATDYFSLKETARKGVKLEDKKGKSEYRNQNFALLRLIIPRLNGVHASSIVKRTQGGLVDTEIDLSHGYYLAYLNKHLFAPLNINKVTARPADGAGWCYPFPAANQRGDHFGDQTRISGSTGLHMSSSELLNFMYYRNHSNFLLSKKQRDTMLQNNLGVNSVDTSLGKSYFHGGYLFRNLESNPKGPEKRIEVNTYFISFADGTQLVMIMNSSHNALAKDQSMFWLLYDAYKDGFYKGP